jgi:predicted RNA-binding Zn-ribbon protein involved in translation (DUF1610 family)
MNNVRCENCGWTGARRGEGDWTKHWSGGRYSVTGFRAEATRARTDKPCPKCNSHRIKLLLDPVTGKWLP